MTKVLRHCLLLFILTNTSLFIFAQELKLMLPIGHTNWVNSAIFSPDGKKIVTASRDETTKIWDVATGNLLSNLDRHTGIVNSAVFSPDGKKILTSSDDKTAKVWDAFSGVLLLNLTGHSGMVNNAAYSPDGKKILTVSNDGTARTWDASSGSLLLELTKHKNKINTGVFSDDGRKILTASSDSTAKIWDAGSGVLLLDLQGHTGAVRCGVFSPDQKKIVTASDDNTAKIWDALSGTLLASLKGENLLIRSAVFSPDSKMVATSDSNGVAKVWEANTGRLLRNLSGHTNAVNTAIFSPDGKKILTTSYDSTAKIWDAASGNLVATLKGHTDVVWFAAFSRNGKNIITASDDNTSKLWNAGTGALLSTFEGHSNRFYSAVFSPDGKKIVTASDSKVVKIWDAKTGSLINNLAGHKWIVYSANFSPDGKKVITASRDGLLKIWDAQSGNLIKDVSGHTNRVYTGNFSPDGEKIVSASYDSTAKIWNATSGNLLVNLKGHKNVVNTAVFSSDGQQVLTASNDNTAKLWDAGTGKLLMDLTRHTGVVNAAAFSPDGRKIITASGDSTVGVWDVPTGRLLNRIKSRTKIRTAIFGPDNSKIVVSLNNEVAIWDAETGNTLIELKGHTNRVRTVNFSPDGLKIITASWDNSCKVWNAANGELLYTFVAVDSTDYLIVDKYNRYSGTEAARKMLYYTCGTEIISLDQVKDQLWVPNLEERINNGDSINGSKLADLNICGLTPLVEPLGEISNQYHFKITPRRGGLAETVVYVNGNETRRYNPAQLHKIPGGYKLIIPKSDLTGNFVTGQSNPITVKAYIASNDISSRDVTILNEPGNKTTVVPNLYAVIIGISDYKGDDLDLKYAAKDGNDISHALQTAAKKWLNRDGKEHVLMYNLTTSKDHYLLPEKNSIRKTFEDIAKKATANDLLLIFFAGHGTMHGTDKKQFYFLTADASKESATGTMVANVGISTQELIGWIRPANIKAQKRILIIDACNSGQAINDLVKIGRTAHNYVAVRGDDNTQQIKSIDKLNERSGLFILAASASNQSAYEMSRYSQGLLTYALLKVMKQNPAILEDNQYLNVSRWFNAAENTVTELMKETGERQQPQIVSTTNFNIGIVDDDVLQTISLPDEKPVFVESNFQNNDENIVADDLNLGKLINNNLSAVASTDIKSDITFIPASSSPGSYSINGRYDVKGDSISVKINIRQNNAVTYKFEINGLKTKIKELAKGVVELALKKIDDNN